ncbi:maleylpyruvate isomerase family mycothiol-dependent enzyme [Actinokineospora sp. 24-640]
MIVDYAAYIDHIRDQTNAMRAAAEKAGPDAPVGTCPGWTVTALVEHLATLQSWVRQALPLPPEGPAPERPTPPAQWPALLDWWASEAEGMYDLLAATDPATRIWSFLPIPDVTAGWFARRGAHEVAIHRLDAEHAVSDEVPTLLYDTEFAADGVDELLDLVGGAPARTSGTVLLHAADAERVWLITLTEGEPLRVETTGLDADATVVGTADAVYRAVWGRPSTAVLGGDAALVAALKSF